MPIVFQQPAPMAPQFTAGAGFAEQQNRNWPQVMALYDMLFRQQQGRQQMAMRGAELQQDAAQQQQRMAMAAQQQQQAQRQSAYEFEQSRLPSARDKFLGEQQMESQRRQLEQQAGIWDERLATQERIAEARQKKMGQPLAFPEEREYQQLVQEELEILKGVQDGEHWDTYSKWRQDRGPELDYYQQRRQAHQEQQQKANSPEVLKQRAMQLTHRLPNGQMVQWVPYDPQNPGNGGKWEPIKDDGDGHRQKVEAAANMAHIKATEAADLAQIKIQEKQRLQEESDFDEAEKALTTTHPVTGVKTLPTMDQIEERIRRKNEFRQRMRSQQNPQFGPMPPSGPPQAMPLTPEERAAQGQPPGGPPAPQGPPSGPPADPSQSRMPLQQPKVLDPEQLNSLQKSLLSVADSKGLDIGEAAGMNNLIRTVIDYRRRYGDKMPPDVLVHYYKLLQEIDAKIGG